MEAAGLKSAAARAPRKSKSGSTPGSATSSNPGHVPSPYGTPTSGPNPYVNPYAMYESQQYAYPTHTIPPHGVSMAQTQSAASSRVPSPVNGHNAGSMPPQPYFNQPFSPAYGYPPSQLQLYRYSTGGMNSPYPPPHGIYPPSFTSEHGQPHLYSPMQAGFPAHSRESSYGVLTPGYSAGPGPMANGYPGPPPPRAQNSPPLSAGANMDDRRATYAVSPLGRRRSTTDMISQGVVDPNSMSRALPGLPVGYGGYHHSASYTYATTPQVISGRDPNHRTSISSASDGSGGPPSEGSGQKPMLG